jgi:hypothetical protein
LDILKSFEKVHLGKLKSSASLMHNLGLDGLDTVALRRGSPSRFPDEEADAIQMVQHN